LSEALTHAAPVKVHLAPGVYPGPFVLGPGDEIEGPESAVLHAQGHEVVVSVPNGGALRGVSVQGGSDGLVVASGELRLEGVHVSGQRQRAVAVEGGSLRATRARLSASVSAVSGVVLARGARAQLSKVQFDGPFSTAIDARFEAPPEGKGSTLELEDVEITDAVRGLRLVNAGQTRLARVKVERGRAEGVLIIGTKVGFQDLEVADHEEDASFGRDAEVEGRGLTLERAHRVGLALVKARAVLRDVHVSRAGPYGAVQVVSGNLWLERFHFEDSQSYGLSAVQSRVSLRDGTVTRIRDPEGGGGDGIQVRGGRAQVMSVYVDSCEGSGVWAAEHAEVTLVNVNLARTALAAAAVETGARLSGVSVEVRTQKGSGLVVTEGTALLDHWHFDGLSEGVLSPDCTAGAVVKVHEVSTDPQVDLSAPCVGQTGALLPDVRSLEVWSRER
jgi:hypothetical protein